MMFRSLDVSNAFLAYNIFNLRGYIKTYWDIILLWIREDLYLEPENVTLSRVFADVIS